MFVQPKHRFNVRENLVLPERFKMGINLGKAPGAGILEG